MSKILKDLFWLMVVAVVGYFLYVMYRGVTNASNAVSNLANEPSRIMDAIYQDVSDGLSAVAGFFGDLIPGSYGGGTVTASTGNTQGDQFVNQSFSNGTQTMSDTSFLSGGTNALNNPDNSGNYFAGNQ